MTRIRALIVFSLAVAAAAVVAACGGGGGNDENPTTVLDDAVSNGQKVTSGTFDVDLKLGLSGGTFAGDYELKANGPFQSEQGKVPLFDVDVDVEGGGTTFSGGLISTGAGAFVNYKGTDYEVPQNLFDQFAASYTQVQEQNQAQGQGVGLLKAFGLESANFTDLKNEGTEDVDGTETIHVSGAVDVPKLVTALKAQAAAQGGAAQQASSQLDQLTNSVKSADFDFFVGADDKILRKVEGNLDLTPTSTAAGAPTGLTIDFSLTLGDVNQPQEISGPSSAQPLSTLLQQLGLGTSALGGAGGTSSGGSTGAALPQAGGSTAAPSGGATDAYIQCLAQAQGAAATQACAQLIQ